ncbi:MAG: lanthionine synthetase LanC family protein [Chloroflexota bacterium]
MTSYRAQLVRAVKALHIYSPTGFSWFGKRSPRLLPRIEHEITPGTARNYLRYSLQACLYKNFYCTGGATPARDDPQPGERSPKGSHAFVERLSVANSGQGYWEKGWEIAEAEGVTGLVSVRRDGLLVLADERDYRRARPGEVNSSLSLHFGKELPAVSPGFYMAVGNKSLLSREENSPPAEDPQNDKQQNYLLVRLYWNVTPDGAVTLMRLLTPALNEAGIPFRLKTLNDPDRYDRCDAAVLYVRSADYAAVAQIVAAYYPHLLSELREPTPALTMRLAYGLGLAEDPGDGDSFGLHRCGLIADALIHAYEAGKRGVDDILETIEWRFAEAGISLERPYLGRESPDDYTFTGLAAINAGRVQETPKETGAGTENTTLLAQRHKPTSNGDGLEPAALIAQQLVGKAIWYEGRCNWLGTDLVAGREKGGAAATGRQIRMREELRALGPDLYTGTAGVALFLAEYAAVTGDIAARHTALGALRHAFHHADAVRPSDRLGLYTGWPGIALVGARIGRLTGEAEWSQRALDLVDRCVADDHSVHEYDLLAGSAGGIIALTVLYEMLGERSLLDDTVRLGDDLLASGRKERDGSLTWQSVGARRTIPLTGFSHGAAGIGHGLLALWRATGHNAYKDAATSAFQYEAGWFNPLLGNWPDLREVNSSQRRSHVHGSVPYATFWCHGAPGIALSRLHAHAITHDQVMRDEALAALRTTAAEVRHELATGMGNYSLCHGLAGNATILLHGAEMLGTDPQMASFRELAHDVAEVGEYRRNASGVWSCGTGGRSGAQAPGLMLGLAGIGHFYLLRASPDIPSVLLIEPKRWAGRTCQNT